MVFQIIEANWFVPLVFRNIKLLKQNRPCVSYPLLGLKPYLQINSFVALGESLFGVAQRLHNNSIQNASHRWRTFL